MQGTMMPEIIEVIGDDGDEDHSLEEPKSGQAGGYPLLVRSMEAVPGCHAGYPKEPEQSQGQQRIEREKDELTNPHREAANVMPERWLFANRAHDKQSDFEAGDYQAETNERERGTAGLNLFCRACIHSVVKLLSETTASDEDVSSPKTNRRGSPFQSPRTIRGSVVAARVGAISARDGPRTARTGKRSGR